MLGRGRVGVEGFSNSTGMTPPTNDQRVRDDRVVVRAQPQWTASQAGSLRRYRRTSKPEQCAASRIVRRCTFGTRTVFGNSRSSLVKSEGLRLMCQRGRSLRGRHAVVLATTKVPLWWETVWVKPWAYIDGDKGGRAGGGRGRSASTASLGCDHPPTLGSFGLTKRSWASTTTVQSITGRISPTKTARVQTFL